MEPSLRRVASAESESDFEAAIAELMQHGEGVEGGLGDAVFGDQAEAAVERGLDDALLFEDVGEGPVAHRFGEAVALADGCWRAMVPCRRCR